MSSSPVYIDFIDSPAVRDHLRTQPPLSPAQQCILIAQSEICPLTDKLAALRDIQATTLSEDFSRGCWKFQSDDPFPVILDHYIRTREKRLATLPTEEPGVVYVVGESFLLRNDGPPFSRFDAALASIGEIDEDECPPPILRRHIDDPDGAILNVRLTQQLEVCDITVNGGENPEEHGHWVDDLPNGYAYVPHPFKRGDLVRQGESFYVITAESEETGGRFSRGSDNDDMQIVGLSWKPPCRNRCFGSFGHTHIFFTRFGMNFAVPADLPEDERMLAALSLVLRGEAPIERFLELFTNGYVANLENDAIKWSSPDNASDRTGWRAILRSDLPVLSANLFLSDHSFHVFPETIRVQRSGSEKAQLWDTVELTLEIEPRFLGGTGDLSLDDVQTIRAFIIRNLDLFLANWNGRLSFDKLLSELRTNNENQ